MATSSTTPAHRPSRATPAACVIASRTTSPTCSSTKRRSSDPGSPGIRHVLIPRISALLLAGAATLSTLTAGPAAGAAGTPGTPGGVDLLSAGPSAVRLGVTAPDPELVTADSLAAGSALLHLDGWALGRTPGIPALPSRVVRVAVPPTGAVTVRGYGLTSATRDGVTLAPWRGSGDPAAL